VNFEPSAAREPSGETARKTSIAAPRNKSRKADVFFIVPPGGRIPPNIKYVCKRKNVLYHRSFHFGKETEKFDCGAQVDGLSVFDRYPLACPGFS